MIWFYAKFCFRLSLILIILSLIICFPKKENSTHVCIFILICCIAVLSTSLYFSLYSKFSHFFVLSYTVSQLSFFIVSLSFCLFSSFVRVEFIAVVYTPATDTHFFPNHANRLLSSCISGKILS